MVEKIRSTLTATIRAWKSAYLVRGQLADAHDPTESPLARCALPVILAVSVVLALYWVFLVPIFQAPDEPAHFDYALAINAQRGLLRSHGGIYTEMPGYVHPYTFYLLERTKSPSIQFRPHMKVSPDYGTRAYYDAIDRDAPPWPTKPLEQAPNLMVVYPFGFYAVLALWIEGLRMFSDRPMFLFFACRVFSVLLLLCTLILVHGSLRLLHFPRHKALWVTACVGLFPMTTFVSSYIQPDNLGFTLVSLCLYLALKARQSPGHLGVIALLGASLGMLLVTKIHFFICVIGPIAGMLLLEWWAARVPLWRWPVASALLAVPALLLGMVYLWTVKGSPNFYGPASPTTEKMGFILHTLRWFHGALLNYYAQLTHQSFWGIFGWMDTPIVIGRGSTNEIVQYVISIISWIVLALTMFRLEQITSRLCCLFGRGRKLLAVRIAFSDPLINSYFIFTVFMFVLFIRLENRFAAQGRNWLPFLLPIFLTGLVYAPKALTLRRSRMVLTTVLSVGLLAYCLVGSIYAIHTIKKRYYPRPEQAHLEPAPAIAWSDRQA